ncbi:MAG: tripartite tricarboxylate transporter substrate-binding protein [Candidatus Binatia bacterium]
MKRSTWDWFKSSKVQTFKVLGFLILSVVELLNPLNLERASAQTPYYSGKTIRVFVGYQPGDTHDLWARMYTRYMGKYLPGNPTFVVQNMPGAGGMIAANHVFNLTKPDGLTLATIGGALYFNQLIGRAEVRFDWNRFTWIGTPEPAGLLVYMRTDAPYKTLDDLRQTNDPPKCSAAGLGSAGYDLPRLLEDVLGLKFKVISGYPGGADQDLAMERGEVHCRAFTIEAFFGREPYFTWVKKNFVRVLLQTERKRHPKLPDTPTIYELMDQYKTAEQSRRVATVILAGGVFGRPLVGPAGIAPEIVKTLRAGVASALKDPELKAEAEKRNYELDPVGGEEMQRLAKEVMSQPPAVLERMKKVLGE